MPADQGLVSGLSDDEMEDSPRVHVHATQQNLYDQRSVHIQVGVDPDQVIQHVQSVESQAQSMVRDAVTRVHETQHRAERVVHEARVQAQNVVHDTQLRAQRVYDEAHNAVHQARSHASTVEERANALIQEMNARHQSELTRVQDVANQLQYQAHVRSQESDAQLQKLMAVVESQNQALETQRVRNEELSAHVAALQNEVVMLRHSSVPVAPSQDPNGAVNQEELRIVIDSLRREIRQSQNLSIPIQLPVPQRMSIATPPHDTQSACAGYPPAFQGPPSPVKGPRSAHASTATPPFVPPPGQSPSGSSSSSKEGQGPGGFPFGWPDGPPTPSNPGGSSFGDSPHSQHPSLHSVGVGSASLSSEESVYRYKALQSIKIDSLPQDAAAFRGWKNGLVTKL